MEDLAKIGESENTVHKKTWQTNCESTSVDDVLM